MVVGDDAADDGAGDCVRCSCCRHRRMLPRVWRPLIERRRLRAPEPVPVGSDRIRKPRLHGRAVARRRIDAQRCRRRAPRACACCGSRSPPGRTRSARRRSRSRRRRSRRRGRRRAGTASRCAVAAWRARARSRAPPARRGRGSLPPRRRAATRSGRRAGTPCPPSRLAASSAIASATETPSPSSPGGCSSKTSARSRRIESCTVFSASSSMRQLRGLVERAPQHLQAHAHRRDDLDRVVVDGLGDAPALELAGRDEVGHERAPARAWSAGCARGWRRSGHVSVVAERRRQWRLAVRFSH